MSKFIKLIIKLLPILLNLVQGRMGPTSRQVLKRGGASLTIAGLVSAGRLSTSDIDPTLLLISVIVEGIGYLYGIANLYIGTTQRSKAENC